MDAREQRGMAIAAVCKLSRDRDGLWLVPSQSGAEKIYRVNLDEKKCTCPDCTEGGFTCKHYYAAKFTFTRDYLPNGDVIETKTFSLTEKKVYKQDWRAYNLAQSTEAHRFQELLFNLTRGVQELPVKKVGRKPHPTKDAIFTMALKVYGTLSGRRSSCEFVEAFKDGYTASAIPGLKVNQFFENPAFTPILKELIAYSARPLRCVETNFAIDSSGFGSCKFVRWYDEKYGVTRRQTFWIKVHLACGTKTNVVTAVRAFDKETGDCPQFVPLVRETAKSFTIGEVSADKAYGSLDNFEEVASMGGQAFIAFKSGTTGRIGGAFEKAFHYFQFKQEEYMEHYHRRSNVESTFSAIKRKFGDSVRARTVQAMVNEVLCKILAHNICVLGSGPQRLDS